MKYKIETVAAFVTVLSFLLLIISFFSKMTIIISYCSDMHMPILIPVLMNTGNYIVFLAAFYLFYFFLSSLGGIEAGITDSRKPKKGAFFDLYFDDIRLFTFPTRIHILLLVIIFDLLILFGLIYYDSPLSLFILSLFPFFFITKLLSDEPYVFASLSGYSKAGILYFFSSLFFLVFLERTPIASLPAVYSNLLLWIIVFLVPQILALVSFSISLKHFINDRKRFFYSLALFHISFLALVLFTSNYYALIPQRLFYFTRLGNFVVSIQAKSPSLAGRKNRSKFCVVGVAHNDFYLYPIIKYSNYGGTMSNRTDINNFFILRQSVSTISTLNRSPNILFTNRICPPIYGK